MQNKYPESYQDDEHLLPGKIKLHKYNNRYKVSITKHVHPHGKYLNNNNNNL